MPWHFACGRNHQRDLLPPSCTATDHGKWVALIRLVLSLDKCTSARGRGEDTSDGGCEYSERDERGHWSEMKKAEEERKGKILISRVHGHLGREICCRRYSE